MSRPYYNSNTNNRGSASGQHHHHQQQHQQHGGRGSRFESSRRNDDYDNYSQRQRRVNTRGDDHDYRRGVKDGSRGVRRGGGERCSTDEDSDFDYNRRRSPSGGGGDDRWRRRRDDSPARSARHGGKRSRSRSVDRFKTTRRRGSDDYNGADSYSYSPSRSVSLPDHHHRNADHDDDVDSRRDRRRQSARSYSRRSPSRRSDADESVGDEKKGGVSSSFFPHPPLLDAAHDGFDEDDDGFDYESPSCDDESDDDENDNDDEETAERTRLLLLQFATGGGGTNGDGSSSQPPRLRPLPQWLVSNGGANQTPPPPQPSAVGHTTPLTNTTTTPQQNAEVSSTASGSATAATTDGSANVRVGTGDSATPQHKLVPTSQQFSKKQRRRMRDQLLKLLTAEAQKKGVAPPSKGEVADRIRELYNLPPLESQTSKKKADGSNGLSTTTDAAQFPQLQCPAHLEALYQQLQQPHEAAAVAGSSVHPSSSPSPTASSAHELRAIVRGQMRYPSGHLKYVGPETVPIEEKNKAATSEGSDKVAEEAKVDDDNADEGGYVAETKPTNTNTAMSSSSSSAPSDASKFVDTQSAAYQASKMKLPMEDRYDFDNNARVHAKSSALLLSGVYSFLPEDAIIRALKRLVAIHEGKHDIKYDIHREWMPTQQAVDVFARFVEEGEDVDKISEKKTTNAEAATSLLKAPPSLLPPPDSKKEGVKKDNAVDDDDDDDDDDIDDLLKDLDALEDDYAEDDDDAEEKEEKEKGNAAATAVTNTSAEKGKEKEVMSPTTTASHPTTTTPTTTKNLSSKPVYSHTIIITHDTPRQRIAFRQMTDDRYLNTFADYVSEKKKKSQQADGEEGVADNNTAEVTKNVAEPVVIIAGKRPADKNTAAAILPPADKRGKIVIDFKTRKGTLTAPVTNAEPLSILQPSIEEVAKQVTPSQLMAALRDADPSAALPLLGSSPWNPNPLVLSAFEQLAFVNTIAPFEDEEVDEALACYDANERLLRLVREDEEAMAKWLLTQQQEEKEGRNEGGNDEATTKKRQSLVAKWRETHPSPYSLVKKRFSALDNLNNFDIGITHLVPLLRRSVHRYITPSHYLKGARPTTNLPRLSPSSSVGWAWGHHPNGLLEEQTTPFCVLVRFKTPYDCNRVLRAVRSKFKRQQQLFDGLLVPFRGQHSVAKVNQKYKGATATSDHVCRLVVSANDDSQAIKSEAIAVHDFIAEECKRRDAAVNASGAWTPFQKELYRIVTAASASSSGGKGNAQQQHHQQPHQQGWQPAPPPPPPPPPPPQQFGPGFSAAVSACKGRSLEEVLVATGSSPTVMANLDALRDKLLQERRRQQQERNAAATASSQQQQQQMQRPKVPFRRTMLPPHHAALAADPSRVEELKALLVRLYDAPFDLLIESDKAFYNNNMHVFTSSGGAGGGVGGSAAASSSSSVAATAKQTPTSNSSAAVSAVVVGTAVSAADVAASMMDTSTSNSNANVNAAASSSSSTAALSLKERLALKKAALEAHRAGGGGGGGGGGGASSANTNVNEAAASTTSLDDAVLMTDTPNASTTSSSASALAHSTTAAPPPVVVAEANSSSTTTNTSTVGSVGGGIAAEAPQAQQQLSARELLLQKLAAKKNALLAQQQQLNASVSGGDGADASNSGGASPASHVSPSSSSPATLVVAASPQQQQQFPSMPPPPPSASPSTAINQSRQGSGAGAAAVGSVGDHSHCSAFSDALNAIISEYTGLSLPSNPSDTRGAVERERGQKAPRDEEDEGKVLKKGITAAVVRRTEAEDAALEARFYRLTRCEKDSGCCAGAPSAAADSQNVPLLLADAYKDLYFSKKLTMAPPLPPSPSHHHPSGVAAAPQQPTATPHLYTGLLAGYPLPPPTRAAILMAAGNALASSSSASATSSSSSPSSLPFASSFGGGSGSVNGSAAAPHPHSHLQATQQKALETIVRALSHPAAQHLAGDAAAHSQQQPSHSGGITNAATASSTASSHSAAIIAPSYLTRLNSTYARCGLVGMHQQQHNNNNNNTHSSHQGNSHSTAPPSSLMVSYTCSLKGSSTAPAGTLMPLASAQSNVNVGNNAGSGSADGSGAIAAAPSASSASSSSSRFNVDVLRKWQSISQYGKTA